MIKPGDIISYLEMCRQEGVNLQRGMNFHLHGKHSVILMNVSPSAPYQDRIEEGGRVLIYEKLKAGMWVYNGLFRLVDAEQVVQGSRAVFKFKLTLVEDRSASQSAGNPNVVHNRLIPTSVKLEVWKRDGGKCVKCGANNNLHFDHIIPYSKGGASIIAENVQILCARHNLEKRDRIE